MGSVVWPDTLESEIPAGTAFSGYEKYTPQSSSSSVALQHHHHFHYPSGVFHTLGNLAEPFMYKKTHGGEIASWTPDSDIRETKIAYYIEIEVPGVSDKKAVQIACLSPRTLQVDGTAVRPNLIRGRDIDGEAMWDSDAVGPGANGETKRAGVSAKSAQDRGPCQKCADCENATMGIIHRERKIGSWRRLFTLPVGCDTTTLQAKLDAGLLRISVLKKEGFVGEGLKLIEVE